MDLRGLRRFLAVAETLSFSRAAAVLNRSQPGLSRSIQELEAELGMPLFERRGRRILLRPEGELLLRRARRLVEDAEQLRAEARLLARGQTQVLRLGAASNTLERVLPAVLQRYHQTWPNVEVQLRSEGGTSLIAEIERGTLDVIISRMVESDLLESRYIFSMHVVAIVGRAHRLAGRRTLRIEDLDGERLLVPPDNFTSRMLLNAAFRAADLRPYVALESPDINALVALAEAGLGIAVGPSTVMTAARKVAVRAIERDGEPLGCATGLIWSRGRRLAPHIADFIDVAATLLRRDYPGKELKLPPLPRA